MSLVPPEAASSPHDQMRALFMQAPAAIAILEGPGCTFTFANPLYQKLISRSEAALLNHTLREVFPEFVGQGIYEIFESAYATGEPHTFKEFTAIVEKAGKLQTGYYDFTIQPIRSDDGALTTLMLQATEITDQVLTESQRELQELADAMPQLVWITDKDGAVSYYNEQVHQYAGAYQDASGRWHWESMIHPNDLQDTADAWTHAMQTGETYSLEHRIQMADGSYRWHLSRARRRGDKWFGTATDIHERREVSESIRVSERRLRQLVDSNIVGVLFWDMDGGIVDANDALLSMLGYTREDLQAGLDWRHITPPQWEEADQRGAAAVVSEGRHLPFEKQYLHKNGYPVDVIIGSTAFEGTGNRQGVTFVLDISARKSAEQALQKAYEQLQALYGSGQINIGYFRALRDANGNIEDMEVLGANPTVEKLYPSLQPQKRLTEAVPGIKQMEHWQRALKVIETGQPERFEALFEFGEKHSWYDNYYTRYGDGFITQSLNIDERKQAEAEIRKAQEATDQQRRLYETVADNTPDLIYVFDLDYRFTYANKALLQMWGKSWNEAIGKGLLENGYEPWHAEMHHREINQVVATRQPIRGTVSFPHTTLGKRIYDYIFTPVLNEKGEVEAIAGTARDISDINNAEVEMRRLKDQLELTFNTVPAGIALFDASGKILLVNDTSARLSGYRSAREMLSVEDMETYTQKVYEETDFYDEAGQQIAPEAMPANALLHGREGSRKVIRAVRRSDGHTRWVMATASPLHGEDEKLSMVLSTYTDITDQKAAEAVIRESENQFRMLAEKLEQLVTERTTELLRSNADLQQFAHVASHDLKEPLRKIKTFAGMLENKLSRETAPEAVLFLDKINSAAARMTEMVDGVLSYSSLNAGERPVEEIDLCETIRHIESDVEVAVQQRDARIDCGQLPKIEGAPVLIYQLFYNLINNSLKFAKADEPLRITMESEDTMLNGKPAAYIRVKDNGIGFEQEYAERIFDTFSRLNAKDKYEGTGLGLALCKKIVERHGGRISAESRIGEGATFLVTLPLRQDKERI